jgi:hypothetical protein
MILGRIQVTDHLLTYCSPPRCDFLSPKKKHNPQYPYLYTAASYMKSEVLTVQKMYTALFWSMTLSSPISGCRYFGETFCLPSEDFIRLHNRCDRSVCYTGNRLYFFSTQNIAVQNTFLFFLRVRKSNLKPLRDEDCFRYTDTNICSSTIHFDVSALA